MSAYFIKNLDIARPDGAGTVSGGAFFTSENTSEQQKEDVYYSTLLAQLAADKKYSRTEQSSEWYSQFVQILQTIGWVCQSFNFDRASLGKSASADEVVMDCVKTHLTDSGVKAVQNAVNVLKNLGDDDVAMEVFKSKSTDRNKANFQVGHFKDDGGNVFAEMCAFQYETSTEITNPLLSKLKGDSAAAYSASQTMILNSAIYSHMRQPIKDKLGNAAEEYIQPY